MAKTIGITYEAGLDVFDQNAASVVISTGLVRGGGRETTLILSCDAVISIAGGSGTLNEICIAYQANIPVIVVDKFGGWSQQLTGTYLDGRKRYRLIAADTPQQALTLAVRSLQKR